ncbi:hypothetical protein [Kytococcus aerolatus]|uniref:hypothetical protein n=1 Tax=Kytococcus aerolatus TaxID=592308 RepID=UPI00117AF16F|nr:hypothetical protein [Kytococcus aerolatus]
MGPLPAELEQAFFWMEEQGHVVKGEEGPFLTAYPDDEQLGRSSRPVSTSPTGSTGGRPTGSSPSRRPRATAHGWHCGATAVKVHAVVLGSDGETGTVAENPRDLLAMLAVGFDEVDLLALQCPPEEPEAVADFRAWVTAQGIDVPAEWALPEEDGFPEWVEEFMGGQEVDPED